MVFCTLFWIFLCPLDNFCLNIWNYLYRLYMNINFLVRYMNVCKMSFERVMIIWKIYIYAFMNVRVYEWWDFQKETKYNFHRNLYPATFFIFFFLFLFSSIFFISFFLLINFSLTFEYFSQYVLGLNVLSSSVFFIRTLFRIRINFNSFFFNHFRFAILENFIYFYSQHSLDFFVSWKF